MSRVIILDTETTNLPARGGEACEIAYFEVDEKEMYLVSSLQNHKKILDDLFPACLRLLDGRCYHQTFMPLGDFSPEATMVNGFTKENLKGSPCISTFKFPEDVTYLIGHNILFDHEILKRPEGVKLICTKELAIKYLTKASGAGTKGMNTLTGLIERYYPEEAKELISNAHSALQDCKLAYLILLKILEAAPHLDSFEKLAGECKQPSMEIKLPYGVAYDSYTKEYVCTFGIKHKDKPYLDILKEDKSYLVWIVEKSTMNNELKAFVKQFLLDNK